MSETASPVLKGRRLTLRPFLPGDVHDRYLDWLADPVVNEYSQRRGAPRPTAREAQAYLSGLAEGEAVLGIHHPEHGHVGNVKFGPVDRPNGRADISILIGEPAVWGKGVGTEAIYLVSKYLFRTEALNRVDAGSRNPAFIRAVTKLGWKTEGVLRQRIGTPEGYKDYTLLAQLAEEFTERPEFEQAIQD
ncbi:GNAT family N-acetyltransferase [Hwanghaeella sp.]|uniref:GNAT family N-acetyltransferase n=1 Tax=Hwanghaeella sp. TaxID=2605943 RepID=UPI003CCB765A